MKKMGSGYVLPTKIYLMELKTKLSTIKFAKKILERKRDSLREAIKKAISNLSEVIKFLKANLLNIITELLLAANQYKMELSIYSKLQSDKLIIDVIFIPEGGVLLPKLRLDSAPNIRNKLPEGLRALFTRFIENLDVILEVSEILVSLELLLREIEITNRIVNTLEKVVIPDLEEKIGYISNTLSEFMISELTSLRAVINAVKEGN